MKGQLLVIIEGGVVQSVVSPTPDVFRDVEIKVIDYDVDGVDEDELNAVDQSDGREEPATVTTHVVELSLVKISERAVIREPGDPLGPDCQHAVGEDCINCAECGRCSESVDDNETCSKCKEKPNGQADPA